MKHKEVIWFLAFLFTIALSELQAQTLTPMLINVQEKTGTNTLFVLNKLEKLIFTNGNMTFITDENNNTDFVMKDIRFMNFTNLTSTRELINDQQGGFKIYPNPVDDLLNIQYESMNGENVFIQILDVQGKVYYQQNLMNQSGIKSISIAFDSFQKGLYVCRIQLGSKLETIKFIKQ